MISILFVCHGNICRSPMAEFLFRDMVTKQGLEHLFHIASAATSREEIGNPVYAPAKKKLASVGIDCSGKTARQVQQSQYGSFDYFLVMDSNNQSNLLSIFGQDPQKKVHRLLAFTSRPKDIADPWYTGDFDTTYEDIMNGLEGFLSFILPLAQKPAEKTKPKGCPLCQGQLEEGEVVDAHGFFYPKQEDETTLHKFAKHLHLCADGMQLLAPSSAWYCPNCKQVMVLYNT